MILLWRNSTAASRSIGRRTRNSNSKSWLSLWFYHSFCNQESCLFINIMRHCCSQQHNILPTITKNDWSKKSKRNKCSVHADVLFSFIRRFFGTDVTLKFPKTAVISNSRVLSESIIHFTPKFIKNTGKLLNNKLFLTSNKQ